MAPKLKDSFDRQMVERIADELQRGYPALDRAGFVRDSLRGLDRLELLERGAHVAEVIQRHLPGHFPHAARLLLAGLPPPTPSAHPMDSFRYLPHTAWVARYGLDHFDVAMELQHALTQRFTAEFSLRAFLDRELDRTLAVLKRWVRDPSEHVRRLVSEGTRPRLPWAPRVRALLRDPRPVLPLLVQLRDDPSEYVRRSVANHLNDIGKDHPDLLLEVCAEWSKGAPATRQWVLRHALRGLVKQGHPGALALLGFGDGPKVKLRNVVLSPASPRIGETLRFSAELVSRSRSEQSLLVDYAVHYVKARGHTRPKVFKLAQLTLAPGAVAALRGRVSLQQRNTRTHHPGRHALELRVNGTALPLGDFVVRRA